MSDLVRDLLTARRALGQEGEFVFPSRAESGHLEEPKKAFVTLSQRCGFEVNPHALRSTFITVVDNTPAITPLARYALVNHAIDTGDVHTGYVQEVDLRSEEHTSELQSIMRISYAVFCLK